MAIVHLNCSVEKLDPAGDHIRKADGSYDVVEAVLRYYRLQPMFNLTVDEAHTYFVGQQAWLVHNECDFWFQGEVLPEEINAEPFSAMTRYDSSTGELKCDTTYTVRHVSNHFNRERITS
jgi:hypothetical protein